MTIEDILHKLKCGEKAYFRGGNCMKKVLLRSKEIVSSEDALLIFNTYGFPAHLLKILFISHGVDMHDEGFAKLLNEQEERMKNMRQCNEIEH